MNTRDIARLGAAPLLAFLLLSITVAAQEVSVKYFPGDGDPVWLSLEELEGRDDLQSLEIMMMLKRALGQQRLAGLDCLAAGRESHLHQRMIEASLTSIARRAHGVIEGRVAATEPGLFVGSIPATLITIDVDHTWRFSEPNARLLYIMPSFEAEVAGGRLCYQEDAPRVPHVGDTIWIFRAADALRAGEWLAASPEDLIVIDSGGMLLDMGPHHNGKLPPEVGRQPHEKRNWVVNTLILGAKP